VRKRCKRTVMADLVDKSNLVLEKTVATVQHIKDEVRG
jgi:hypothetical protein